MFEFALLLIPSLLVLIFMKFKYDHHISTKEVLIHAGLCVVGALVVLAGNYAFLYSNLTDTEILNGEVISKYNHKETCTQSSSCKHYYTKEKCRSYTDSKGKRQKSCTTYKVFDYPYEIDWYVKTTVGESRIERVNSQGTYTPQRWEIVKKGDPASAENTYMNYLFADEHSLFTENKFEDTYDEKYRASVPPYPYVYDYYKTNHVINLTNLDISGIDDYISNELKVLGPEKQLNIVVVIYSYKDSQMVNAIISKWRGGKKNDVIMFYGIDENGVVQSYKSTSFAQGMNNEKLHADLRINAFSKKMSIDLIQDQVHNISTEYKRLPNETFSFLKYKLQPKKEVLLGCSFILLVLSIVVGVYMRENEL